MIEVLKHGVILGKTDFGFESAGVLNPAVIKEGHFVHVFYRAVRNGNYSTIGYCCLNGPLTIYDRYDMPVLFPQGEHESHGIEDPRISKIDGLYYLTYTAYDGTNALGAYATSEELSHFEKKGILTPQITFDDFRHLAESHTPLNEKYLRFNGYSSIHSETDNKRLLWSKNIVFFPRRIQGKLHFLQRIKPDIQLVAIERIEELTASFWENYIMHFQEHIVLEPTFEHEVSYIGGGCPPIETEHGWLLIYHGVHDTQKGYVYSACVALLDLEDPRKEIARLPYPLFKPEFAWELRGEVNNVCFPTGTALFDDNLYIYYGAADESIACASVNFPALLAELLLNPKINIK